MTESKCGTTKPVRLTMSQTETTNVAGHSRVNDTDLEAQALGAVYGYILERLRERKKEPRQGNYPFEAVKTTKLQLANQADYSYDDIITHLERKELTRQR